MYTYLYVFIYIVYIYIVRCKQMIDITVFLHENVCSGIWLELSGIFQERFLNKFCL